MVRAEAIFNYIAMKEFTLKASADDLLLHVALAECPEGVEAKGILQVVHGMCEHKERYYDFMEWVASKGYVCIIHDHRGHGASLKSKGDLGYLYDGGWQAMVEDVDVVGDWVRKNYPDLPFSLLGHSMGSMVVRSYAKLYDSNLDVLIVCGSPSDNPAKKVGRILSAFLGLILGWKSRPALLQKLSFGSFNKKFAHEGYSSAWVCSKKEVLEEYHSDPLCQYQFTANGFYGLLGLMIDCYSKSGWAVVNEDLPIFFISGSEDPCRRSDKAFENAVKLMKEVGYTNVSSKTYPGMRHEILQEVGKEEVWDDILAVLPQ